LRNCETLTATGTEKGAGPYFPHLAPAAVIGAALCQEDVKKAVQQLVAEIKLAKGKYQN